MQPRDSHNESDTAYSSESVLKQKTFPDRRSHVKNRRSLPAKIERQSTLTQRWSFDGGSSQGHNDDDADEIEDFEDEEYGAQEPKKKRRKTLPTRSGKKKDKGVGKGQNTMTQMGYVSFSSNVEDQHDDGGEERVMFTASDEDEDERVPESVTSQDDTTIARRVGGRIRSEELGNDVGDALVRPLSGPSPEIELSLSHPTTPKKTFPAEIPSSNTPQSAIMWSTHSRATHRSPSKSPLKNRSMNVLDSPTRALRPIPETPAKEAASFSPWSVTKTPIFRVPALPARRVSVAKPTPRLERRSTIPDSDDMLVEETQHFKSSKLVTARRLKRVPSTIQDTQFDVLGLEVTDDMEIDDEQDDDQQVNDAYGGTMDCSYPYYDTVASALDRDAARYMQTQRLKDAQRAMRPDIVPDTQEGSAEDLLAGRRQLPDTAVDFASSQNIGHTFKRQQSQSQELGQMDDDTSTHSQSLPATPAKPERSHHRKRFHDIPVVDLTADSFEPVIPTTSGTPTPKTGSQAPIDIHRQVSSPTNKDNRNISSSPPLISRGNNEDADGTVEFLQLNDVEPRPATTKRKKQHEIHISSQPLPQPENSGHLVEGDLLIPPSQVSTVGNPTQVFRSQLRRTQIKQEQDDLYCATPRIPRDLHQDVSLDPEDEDIDIYETVLTNGDLNAGRIEHVNLSDQPDPDDLEDDYVELDRIEERVSPSSPLPPAPGHTLAEYKYDDNEETSSDFAHITSPPHGSSQHGDRGSSSSHTSPATHAHIPDLRTEEQELTPRALTDKAVPNAHDVADTGASPKKGGSSHPHQPLSALTKGKQPLYTIPSSQPDGDEDSLSNPRGEDHCGNNLTIRDTDSFEQHSWRFRPANEILPDTQFSLIFPPVPSSDDHTQEQGELEQAQRQKLHNDVSLAPPPKSSYEWMAKRLRKG
ncbi:hypothetical protein BDV97DRAFT_398486 [Delphinella strobiligena]|nr:hypothetical protein BDV97DRAFT_398486 [Delphinella strobiligena]